MTNIVISEKIRAKMCKVVGEHIDHRSIEAIRRKYRVDTRTRMNHIHYADLLETYDKIFELRLATQRLNRRRADGRILGIDYLGIERWYDKDGIDEDGFYADGEPARIGIGIYNRDGWRMELLPGYQRPVAMNRDGFTETGVDREGYDREGFSKKTELNRAGFARSGIHSVTKTLFDPEGYTICGFDVNGRNRQGDFNRPVAIALSFLVQSKTKADYATANNMTLKELELYLSEALKFMPTLQKSLFRHERENSTNTLASIVAEIRERSEQGISPEEFWLRYPNIEVRTVINQLSPQEILAFFGPSLRRLKPADPEMIHSLAKICNNRVPSEIAYLVQRLKMQLRQTTAKEPIELANHLAIITQAIQPHLDVKIHELYTGFSIGTMSGGFVVMRDFTAEDVKHAIASLESRGGVLSRKGVYNEVMKDYR